MLLQLARPPPGGVLWSLVGDPLAKRDLARQGLLYDQPIVPVARVRNIVALLTLVLWRSGTSCKRGVEPFLVTLLGLQLIGWVRSAQLGHVPVLVAEMAWGGGNTRDNISLSTEAVDL